MEFTDEISDLEWGRTIHFKVPGDFEVELYQPLFTKGGSESVTR